MNPKHEFRRYQYSDCNHKQSCKHTIKEIKWKIKEILTGKKVRINGQSYLRFNARLSRHRRFYYHDNRFIDPWINLSNIQKKDWTIEKLALKTLARNDSDCVKLFEKINEQLDPNNKVDTKSIEKEEAKENEENNKKVLYCTKNKRKICRSKGNSTEELETSVYYHFVI